MLSASIPLTLRFQSTPSARRATGAVPTGCLCAKISIHALREESDSCGTGPAASKTISIHALRGESDGAYLRWHPARYNFNPRSPWGERRLAGGCAVEHVAISIHALREEGDRAGAPTPQPASDFNPRPPRGERLHEPDELPGGFFISIHALREESDGALQKPHTRTADFNPRPPRGERRRTRSKSG